MKFLLTSFFLFAGIIASKAQEIPLLNQKLTDAFIYNPSFAGVDGGTIVFSHRIPFNQVAGSGKINYLSADMPLSLNNFGVGLSVYNEKINFLNNTYVSGAFAYHIDLGNQQLLSMGVAAEYNNIQADIDQVVGDLSDEMLTLIDAGEYNKIDYSAGINYQHRYFKVGISTNRLATAFEGNDKENILTQYYTALGRFMLPVRGGVDLVEPMIIYRKFSRVSHSLDIGCYYTFKELILLGVSARLGGGQAFATSESGGVDVINVTGGFKLMKKLLLGYSLDITSNNVAALGPSHEFTLSYEFLNNDNSSPFNRKSPTNYKGNFKRRRKRH